MLFVKNSDKPGSKCYFWQKCIWTPVRIFKSTLSLSCSSKTITYTEQMKENLFVQNYALFESALMRVSCRYHHFWVTVFKKKPQNFTFKSLSSSTLTLSMLLRKVPLTNINKFGTTQLIPSQYAWLTKLGASWDT